MYQTHTYLSKNGKKKTKYTHKEKKLIPNTIHISVPWSIIAFKGDQ